MKRLLYFVIVVFLTHTVCISTGESSESLEGWMKYSQREALEPVMNINKEAGTLEMASNGHFRCNGAWKKSIPVEPGRFFIFHAEYQTANVDFPRRSVLAKVYWRNDQGNRIEAPDYPRLQKRREGEWKVLENVFKVPSKASIADLELIFRWDADGNVKWRNVSFVPSRQTPSRKVTLGTINYRHQNGSGPGENRKAYDRYIREAAESGAKILCLPEGFTVVGTGKSYLEVAEPVPGPSTEFLGKMAKEYGIYIAAGIYELDGETAYNTAVFMGRDGRLIGKYRKVSLPREEIEQGLTPGDEFPVFDTEYGKVGILICWDIQFPEGARRLASRGAEIILLPIWGGTEPLYPARAIENQIFLVSSSYDSTTGIWNKRGEVLARADEEGSIAVAEVDLNEEIYWDWVGNLRSRIARESPIVDEVEIH